jgi:hypothetical protein
MAVTTTWRTPVCGSASSSVWQKFSRMISAVAPESFSWCSSSRAVYSGLTLTQVYPARSTAAIATANCGTFGSMIATRAPGSNPRDCSQAPSDLESSSSWRYDIHRSMQTEKGRPACLRKDSSSSCVSEVY